LVNTFNKLITGCQLGHPRLSFLFELSQSVLSNLSSGGVSVFVFGRKLPEVIQLVHNRLLLSLDLLKSLSFVGVEFLDL
jgi:hypothetical protein